MRAFVLATLPLLVLGCSASPSAVTTDAATHDGATPVLDAKTAAHDAHDGGHDAAAGRDAATTQTDARLEAGDARPGEGDARSDAADAADAGTAHDGSVALTRSAFLWPFGAMDPFNIGLGDGATWSATWSTTPSNMNGAQQAPSYSIPVYLATSTSPIQTINGVSLKVPLGAAPASGTDHHMSCVQAKGSIASFTNYAMYGFYGVAKGASGPPDTYTNTGYGTNGPFDLTAYSTHYDGRASNILQMGGLVRPNEVVAGLIPHAIAAALDRGSMAAGFIWPATAQDSGAAGYTGTTHMGSVLGIPSSVDLGALGLTAGGLVLATALQDYGAIVIDSGDSSEIIFYAEDEYDEGTNTAAFTTGVGQMKTDLAKIASHLKLLTNQQTSQALLDATGAWGTGSTASRAPKAPPFD